MDIDQITDELDFHYLLSILPLFSKDKRYELLPELFSCIGIESFIKLCKYAGGEVVQIPTIDELLFNMQCLRYFYNVRINRSMNLSDVPVGYIKQVSEMIDNYEIQQL